MIDYYQIARMSVKSVISRGIYQVCEDDFQDMLQTAVLAIWQAPPGHSEAYYFQAGRIAARGWLIWWKYGASRDKILHQTNAIQNLVEPVSLDSLNHPVIQRIYPRSPMPDWMTAELRAIFAKRRIKHGRKHQDAIERDLKIISALIVEHDPIGIGQDMGISTQLVSAYRQAMRKRMEDYIHAK